MAIIEDRRVALRKKIMYHEARAKLAGSGTGQEVEGDAMEEDGGFDDVRAAVQSGDQTSIEQMKQSELMKADEFKRRLAAAQETFDQWKVDNIRRKHNYIPFIVKVLKILAKKKQLQKLIKKAEEKRMQREADLKAQK